VSEAVGIAEEVFLSGCAVVWGECYSKVPELSSISINFRLM
jgi:hypothetical protein